MRGDFLGCDFAVQGVDFGMRHGVGNGGDAEQLSGIGDELMAAVEDAQLHGFVGVYVIAKGCPGVIPVGATATKTIFDHPLTERFVGDRSGVINAECAGQGPFSGAGGGHDAIDHGVGEGACVGYPIGQFGIGQSGQGQYGLAQQATIAW